MINYLFTELVLFCVIMDTGDENSHFKSKKNALAASSDSLKYKPIFLTNVDFSFCASSVSASS